MNKMGQSLSAAFNTTFQMYTVKNKVHCFSIKLLFFFLFFFLHTLLENSVLISFVIGEELGLDLLNQRSPNFSDHFIQTISQVPLPTAGKWHLFYFHKIKFTGLTMQ